MGIALIELYRRVERLTNPEEYMLEVCMKMTFAIAKIPKKFIGLQNILLDFDQYHMILQITD